MEETQEATSAWSRLRKVLSESRSVGKLEMEALGEEARKEEMVGWMGRTMTGISTLDWTAVKGVRSTMSSAPETESRGELTMQETQFELSELLLGHGDTHLAVSILASLLSLDQILLLGTPLPRLLALDERLKSGRDSVVHQPVQALVYALTLALSLRERGSRLCAVVRRSARRRGKGSLRGGTEEVEEVQLRR